MPSQKSYSELLRDPRWQRRRLEILGAAGFKCEDCGCDEKELHVHHCFYKKGLEPWDHGRWHLMALCRDCHEIRQELEARIHGAVAILCRFTPSVKLDEMFWYFAQEAAVSDHKADPDWKTTIIEEQNEKA